MSLDKVDVIEVNEAFAAQFLAVQKDLGLDLNKTNINGGAIALGKYIDFHNSSYYNHFSSHQKTTSANLVIHFKTAHPIGMSGGRILVNLTHELMNSNKKYAIASLCIGGGQGIAMLIERV